MRSGLAVLVACAALVVTGCTAGSPRPAPRSPSAAGSVRTPGSSAPGSARPADGYTSIADACSNEGSVCNPSGQPTGSLPPSLTRPLRLPRIRAGHRCPATPGREINSPRAIRGLYLGTGPVRPKVGGGYGDQPGAARGIVHFDSGTQAGWHGFKTIWAVDSSYTGPVIIRGARLDRPGAMFFGESPTSSELIIPGGRTLNEYDGVRTAPGGTWVRNAGCYGWQIDGPNLSEVIIVSVTDPPARP